MKSVACSPRRCLIRATFKAARGSHCYFSTSTCPAEVLLVDGAETLVEYRRAFLTRDQSQLLLAALMPTSDTGDTSAAGAKWERDSLQPYPLRARANALAQRRGGVSEHITAETELAQPRQAPSTEGESGETLVTPRRVCTFGDVGTRYSYTNISREGKGWPPFMAELKAEVEAVAQQRFNFVFCNLYENEREYIGWHQDKEEAIVKRSAIATVSLGAPRRFCLRHDKTKRISQVVLEEGSLLLMKGSTQERYRHSLPRADIPCGPRISLTFRLLHAGQPPSVAHRDDVPHLLP